MKALFLTLLVSMVSAQAALTIPTGDFKGVEGKIFKSDCSLKIYKYEATGRQGNYTAYDITAQNDEHTVDFSMSESSAKIGLKYKTLSTSNGTDTSGEKIAIKLNENGTPVSYVVTKYISVFWTGKSKDIIKCNLK